MKPTKQKIKNQEGGAEEERKILMNDHTVFAEFLTWIAIAIIIWIILPIWIYTVAKLISSAWFKGKIETQKEQQPEEVNGTKD